MRQPARGSGARSHTLARNLDCRLACCAASPHSSFPRASRSSLTQLGATGLFPVAVFLLWQEENSSVQAKLDRCGDRARICRRRRWRRTRSSRRSARKSGRLKEGYEQRIQALEKRLEEAEAKAGKAETTATKAESTRARRASAPKPKRASSAANRSGENAFNPAVSLILQGTYANTSQDPNTYQITGFVPSGGEVGPPKRSFGLGETELAIVGQYRSLFPRRRDCVARARRRGRGRGGVLPDAGAAARLHAQGRALLLRHRLSERAAPARVGLPGRAAGVQGVSRQPAQAGRRAAQVDRADRPVCSSSARNSAPAISFPAATATRTASAAARCSRISAATSAPSTAWRAGLSYLQHFARRPHLRRHRLARRRGDQQLSPATRSCGVSTACSNGRRTAIPTTTTSSCRASISASSRTARSPTTIPRGSNVFGVGQRLLQHRPVRLVRAGRVAVHAALARRLPLRHAELRHGRTTASSTTGSGRPRPISRCSPATARRATR